MELSTGSANQTPAPQNTGSSSPDQAASGASDSNGAADSNKADAKPGKDADGKGSKAVQEAIQASKEAGSLVKLLALKGFMDSLQRDKVQRSLEQLNQKIGAVKQEAVSGRISPIEYQAARIAIEQAYANQAKAKLPQGIELPPTQSLPNSQNGFGSAPNSNLSTSGPNSLGGKDGSLQSANSRNDLAQLDAPIESLKKQNGASGMGGGNSAGSNVGGAGLMGLSGLGNTALGGSLVAGVNPNSHNSVHVELSSDSSSQAKNDSSSEKRQLGENGGFDDETGEFGGSALTLDLDTQNGDSVQLVPSQGSVRPNQRSLMSVQESSGLMKNAKDLLKPIKVQKNLLSSELISEDGIHPLALVFFFLLVFTVGRYRGKKRRVPTVIPEVVLSEEQKPLSQSKAITIRKLG